MKAETNATGLGRTAGDQREHDKRVPVREGEILAGKYRVDRVLGLGGMGVVVAGRHVQLDERVAIKFLLPDTLSNPEAVARFTREARAAVKIKSEHVARVSDVGTLDNGAPYMVMEYLDGADLAAWLARDGQLPVEQSVDFVLQACEAIAEAHALGIVHRDLKPANLFVIRRPDGGLSVKVLDFGISKVTSASGSTPDAAMTRTSAIMGSPLYMAPEQIRSSKDVDARADIWSLGVILYESITGSCPFVAESMPELLYKVMSDAPPALREKRPDAPEGLEAVVLRCLDKDRGKRFESVREFALAVLPFGPKRAKGSVERISGVMKAAGFTDTASMLPASSEPAQSATGASWGRTASRTATGRPKTIGAIAVVALAAAFLLAKSGPSSHAASAGSASAPSLPEPIVSAQPFALPSTAVVGAVPSAAPSVPAPADRGLRDGERPAVSPRSAKVERTERTAATTPRVEPARVAPVSFAQRTVLTATPAAAPHSSAPPRPRPFDIYDERK